LNEGNTEFFEIDKGVRQGCVLSPILYLLFINDLIDELKTSGLLVSLNDITLNSLFFADDIVLLGKSKEDINSLLKIVADYAKTWRFEINIQKSKYMVFGMERGKTTINISGEPLERVKSYKYLGLDIDERLSWQKHKNRVLNAARKHFYLMYSFKSFRQLSTRSVIYAYQMLVRSKFEYGFELWFDEKGTKAFEQFQREVAKRILRASSLTTNQAVLGELGWQEIKFRADQARLFFYHNIMNKSDANICRRVMSSQLDDPSGNSWLYHLKQILEKLSLQYYDMSLISVKSWKKLVRHSIHNYATMLWKQDMEKKPKLRTYIKFKTQLCYEPYLDDVDNRKYLLLRLRVGTNNLAIERDRWKNKVKSQRLCLICNEVEDESHFLLYYSGYNDIRSNFIQYLKTKWNIEQLDLCVLLNQGNASIRKDIYRYVQECYKQRSLLIDN